MHPCKVILLFGNQAWLNMFKWHFLLFPVWVILQSNGQTIANQKCLEYSKAVYQKTDTIITFRSRFTPQTQSTCALYDNPLIVGGVPARPKEFPHMAVIGFESPDDPNQLDWYCGGSLISERHVLTAAHCTTSQNGPPQKVRLGSTSLTENEDYVQEISIEGIMNHPEYHRPRKYHDIAIIFLSEIVKFTSFVRPACLSTLKDFSKNQAIATGFGKTAHGHDGGSNVLLKVDLDIIPNSNCSKYLRFRQYEMPQNLIDEMMCAGYLQGGRDTCQGDSGGPLQVILDEPYCMYSIIGVTSFGRFCGMSYSPGVYTKVDQYVQWIESTIWSN